MKYLLTFALLVGSCFGITPPTLVSHNPAAYNTTTATKTVTPTSGWNAGDILVFTCIAEGSVNGDHCNVPTATGLTFTAVISHAAASNSDLMVATATAASNGSGAISCTHTTTGSGANWGFTIYVFRGSGGVGNNASQFTATRTVSLTPTQADSAIVWTVADFAAAAVQSPAPTPTNADVAIKVSTNYTAYADELTDQVSSGAVSYGIGGSGTGPFSIGVIEINGTAGGAVTCAQSISLMGVGCR